MKYSSLVLVFALSLSIFSVSCGKDNESTGGTGSTSSNRSSPNGRNSNSQSSGSAGSCQMRGLGICFDYTYSATNSSDSALDDARNAAARSCMGSYYHTSCDRASAVGVCALRSITSAGIQLRTTAVYSSPMNQSMARSNCSGASGSFSDL